MLACTWPFGPIVRLFPRSSMLPSTWPSTYKSSLPESSPLITTDFPISANSAVLGVSIKRSLLGQFVRPLLDQFQTHFFRSCQFFSAFVLSHAPACRDTVDSAGGTRKTQEG